MRPKMDPYQQIMMIGIFVAVAVALAGCATSGDRYAPTGPAPDLAGTRWVVTSIDGVAPLNDTVVRADFGVDGRVNGDSGCNSFSGPYIQTGNSVQIGELLSTRRACLDGSAQRQENRVLHILQGPNTARLSRGQLNLRSNDGWLVLAPGITVAETSYSYPRRVEFDCEGIPLTVMFDVGRAELAWRDGRQVLHQHAATSGIWYETAGNSLRGKQELMWVQDGRNPRLCRELR